MKEIIERDFKEVIENIKVEIKNTQLRVAMSANIDLINMYFRLGKILNENYKYGNKFIDEISIELKLEFPNATGFSVRNLKYMKKFYLEYKDNELMQQAVAQVPWGHNILLMTKIKDIDIRKIYIDAVLKNNWGRDMLAFQIENNYHLRIGNTTNNFKISLSDTNSDLANNILKDPYVFNFISLKQNYREYELETAMIERIKDVLLELGTGFSFLGNQYKISTENKDYYLDLLFYHLDLRCYIVVELKTTEFEPEYIGQLGFYVKAVDHTLKKDIDNETIGLLLCRDKDRFTAQWSLESTNVPIGVSTYKIKEKMSKDLLEKLPTEEEINLHINLDD